MNPGNVWFFRRRVNWGECDPAGIVYTPRFAEYVAEAHLAFFEHVFAAPPYEVLGPLRMALPAKALAIEFKSSLRPNEWFDLQVVVGEIRTRTYTLDMTARDNSGAAPFVAKITLICLDRTSNKGVPIPQFVRARLMEFHGTGGRPSGVDD
jgi:acyl-CoA thioester hydrolase